MPSRAIIGAVSGAGWIAVSFLTENLFPVGDWRWAIAAAICFVVAFVVYLGQRRAVLTRKGNLNNPGDGREVARLIMRAPTIVAVEAHYADFQSYSYQSSAQYVAAARRIRQAHAEGVENIPWEFSAAAEKAAAPFGRDKYRRAVFDLIAEFPEFGGEGWRKE